MLYPCDLQVYYFPGVRLLCGLWASSTTKTRTALKKGDTSLCGATFGALVVCSRRHRPCGRGELSSMFGLAPRLESSLWAGEGLHDQVHIPPSLRTFVHPGPTRYRGTGAAVSLGRPCHDNRIVLPFARLWATPGTTIPRPPGGPIGHDGSLMGHRRRPSARPVAWWCAHSRPRLPGAPDKCARPLRGHGRQRRDRVRESVTAYGKGVS